MKLWIFVILVLLVPGVAWAEVTGTPPLLSWTNGTDPMLDTDVWPFKEFNCRAKMEAAMRAMEYWSLLNFEGVDQARLDIVKPDKYDNYWAVLPAEERLHEYTPYGLTQLLNVKAAKAIVLWDTVKRDCWRENP